MRSRVGPAGSSSSLGLVLFVLAVSSRAQSPGAARGAFPDTPAPSAAPSESPGQAVPAPRGPAPVPAPSPAPESPPGAAPARAPGAPEGFAPPPSSVAPSPPPYGAAPYGAAPSPYPYGNGPPAYPPVYPYGYGPPPPGWGAPARDPHARRHDGFYFRFGSGPAYGRAKTSGSLGGTTLTAHYAGAGPVYELLFGGTVARGFVVGGGFLGQDIWDPDTTIESNDPNVPSTLQLNGALGVLNIGPFIDWFPDDTGGAHVGGMIGIGGIGLKDRSGNADIGLGGSVWAGYDFWIANQWSLGGELRALFAQGTRDVEAPTGLLGTTTSKFDDSAASFELVFTVLLH